MIKIKSVFMIFLIMIIISSYQISYAVWNTVTKDKLEESFKELNDEVVMTDDIIKLQDEEKNYEIKYDLTEKPVFYISVPIYEGMTYTEFNEKIGTLDEISNAYLAIAHTQSVESTDATIYWTQQCLANAFSNTNLENIEYIIVDDENLPDGVTIEKDESDDKTIYTSEFGKHVIKYTNAIYKMKQICSDNKGFNTFTWTIEQKDKTETSCNLVSTLTINTDSDFSQLKGFAESINPFSDVTEENAEYILRLKVGQKCEIKSNKKLTGYGMDKGGCIEISDDYTEITALKPGKARGYIYLSDGYDEQTNFIKSDEISIYIIVEENVSNESIDKKILEINSENNDNSNIITNTSNSINVYNQTNNNNNNNNSTDNIDSSTNINSDNTVVQKILPNTGVNKAFLIVVTITIGFTLIFGILLRKYKDI